jgi:hypothetical protein
LVGELLSEMRLEVLEVMHKRERLEQLINVKQADLDSEGGGSGGAAAESHEHLEKQKDQKRRRQRLAQAEDQLEMSADAVKRAHGDLVRGGGRGVALVGVEKGLEELEGKVFTYGEGGGGGSGDDDDDDDDDDWDEEGRLCWQGTLMKRSPVRIDQWTERHFELVLPTEGAVGYLTYFEQGTTGASKGKAKGHFVLDSGGAVCRTALRPHALAFACGDKLVHVAAPSAGVCADWLRIARTAIRNAGTSPPPLPDDPGYLSCMETLLRQASTGRRGDLYEVIYRSAASSIRLGVGLEKKAGEWAVVREVLDSATRSPDSDEITPGSVVHAINGTCVAAFRYETVAGLLREACASPAKSKKKKEAAVVGAVPEEDEGEGEGDNVGWRTARTYSTVAQAPAHMSECLLMCVCGGGRGGGGVTWSGLLPWPAALVWFTLRSAALKSSTCLHYVSVSVHVCICLLQSPTDLPAHTRKPSMATA